MTRRPYAASKSVAAAVRAGVARGLTAKEASYESGIPPSTLTKAAKRLGLAFKWAKIAKVPHHMPMPTETLLNRERDLNRSLVIRIQKALASIAPSNPAYIILTDSIGLARRKTEFRS